MLGTSGEVIIDNVIVREEVGRTLINKSRLIGATGSTITGYPWENRFQSDRLSVGWFTSIGPTNG